jgi:MFS family permease
VFGYFDTIANFWWIMAALAGMVLVKFFPIHVLLFLITPTALIAAVIIWRFRRHEQPLIKTHTSREKRMILRELFGWSGALKWMAVFNFFISGAAAVVAFYLPIEVYRDGASLSAVIAMGVISTIPVLFGWGFGALFDAIGGRVFIYGLVVFAGLLLLLGVTEQYLWQVVAFFGINLVIELLSVGSNELITIHARPEQFGRVASIISSISMVGTLAAPLVVGIMIDSYGVSSSYFTLGSIMLALALLFTILHKRGFMRTKTVVEAEVVG